VKKVNYKVQPRVKNNVTRKSGCYYFEEKKDSELQVAAAREARFWVWRQVNVPSHLFSSSSSSSFTFFLYFLERYVSLAHAATMHEQTGALLQAPVCMATVVRIGTTRLLDNIILAWVL
jgi:hypothetical protein